MAAITGTLTIALSNNASTTLTITSNTSAVSLDYCRQFVQNLYKNGSLFDNNGVWYPITAVESITIS